MQGTHASVPSRERREHCSLTPPLKQERLRKANEEDAPRLSGRRTVSWIPRETRVQMSRALKKIQRTAQLERSKERAGRPTSVEVREGGRKRDKPSPGQKKSK
ncbi:hypothetical protein NDU88_006251 [Pleurodeles waltl]|uniref:Uncharacterized protein n=1 Tax=Pleurodeles waltl TaxID=8319 RepID=A0AAV7MF84_PLEWA|nr:hypothetical protein NDU88_006251 [Pleurodeles waltl]